MAAAVSGAEEEKEAMATKPPADGRAGESGMEPGTATVAAGGGGGGGGGESEEEEEEENVYEVEKILDMKTEDGEVKYKVRWKGYAPDDDTWEPEEHLKDCKEVLLEFRKKMLDNKSKPVKKEIQKLPLNDDLFEADSEADSDWQSDTKGDRSPKKKKKKSKDKEDKSQDEMQKKKSKLGKVKEKPFLECENSSDSLASDSKPKKRTSESKEEIKDSKKQRREDIKDNKKKESKDGKKKMKEESKENKHMQKGKHSINHLDGESSMQDDSFSQAADFESEDLDSDSSEEKHKTPSGKYWLEEVSVHQADSTSSTDDSSEIRIKKKKKKRKKSSELDENRKVDKSLEKKSTQKKQKVPEKTKAAELENKRLFISAPAQKPFKLSVDERGCRPNDTGGEGSNNTKWKSKEAKAVQSYGGNVLQKAAIPESKEKNTNWRSDEEKIKEKPSQYSLGENLFEKFIMDMEGSKGGSMVVKKNLSKIELNVEEVPKERGTLPKVISIG
uniref:Chromo domain-containing protein n=1 Tax=Laticauda laticaudata TaxID=8630 RepID=A0A8C5WRG3_LATLA